MESPEPTPRAPWLVAGLAAAAAAAGGLALLAAGGAREAAEQARVEARAASKAAGQAREAAEKAAKGVEDLHGEMELLAASVDAVQRNVKELADKVNFGGAAGSPLGGASLGSDPDAANLPPRQPIIEYTPELRESLRKAVAAKGVDLLEDRVVVPGQVVLRQGALEFLAVLPGGKTHESVLVLTGKPAEEGARVEGLGAVLNSCLMALGLRPGTPLRVLPGGKTAPSKGTPVHIAVEWEEEGKAVRVRAEDLLWDRVRSRSMEEGKFIYVGSWFDPEGYVPDLSLDAVAVYSVSTCVVDLDDPRAADDTIFVACAPRIPPEGTKVRVVFSPKPLEPTRTWDPQDPQKRTDPGAPASAPAGEAKPAKEQGGAGGK
jgi:hypothetical protein